MDGDNRSFPVAFTRGAGIQHWLSAKLQRQPLYGDGEIEFRAEEIIVRGLQRSWLAVSHEGEISLKPASIRNIWHDLRQIEFESKPGWRPSSRFSLHVHGTEDAQEIFNRLVGAQPNKSRFSDSSEFYSRLRATGRKAWVTPALIFLNLCVYLALVIRTGLLGGFDVPTLSVWGANYGPLALNGEW